MQAQQLTIESVSKSIRQGASLTRLRDDTGEAIPIIQVTNLETGGLNLSDFPVEALDADKAVPYRVKPDQILMSQFTSNLRVARVTEEIAEAGAIVGSNVTAITPDKKLVEPSYLLAIFSSQSFHARLELLTGGSTMAQVSVSSLKGIRIPVPSLEKQEELGAAFSEALGTAQAAQRLVDAQQALIEHRVIDLWEGKGLK